MIEVSHLSKRFRDKVAVDDVSFSVEAGTVVGLLGPNGAGKTTTIHCLTTLLPPDSGAARVAGHDVVTEGSQVRSKIALTGQFAAVDETLTGRENLVLFGRLLGLSRGSARLRADELLERFDLADAASKPARGYSGGMRRRLDLAVSLVVERPVLFLDEPTTGLDPRSRHALWSVVRELRSAGTAVLLTTQYMEEADQLSDRMVVLDAGRVVAEGDAESLKRRVGNGFCEVRIEDDLARARAIAALDQLGSTVSVRDSTVTVAGHGTSILVEVVRRLDGAGVEPDDVQLRRPTLDEVFFALTGGSMSRAPVPAEASA